MMSLHVRVPFLVTVFLLQIQLPAYAYGNAMDMTQVVEAVWPMWETQRSSSLLPMFQVSTSHWGHWGSERADQWTPSLLSLPHSVILLFKKILKISFRNPTIICYSYNICVQGFICFFEILRLVSRQFYSSFLLSFEYLIYKVSTLHL